jgi:hypothetical protein
VGDERAETYLRVLAEAELRRVSSRLRLLDAAAGTDVWSPPDSSLFVTAERAQWKVGRTGRILLAAGVLGRRPAPPSPEPKPAAIPPAEHLLRLGAERILATGDAAGPAEGPGPGEIITVLTEAGAIVAGNLLPGQLAALCRRLGAAGHGIIVPPAADIPAEWASVVAHRDAPVPVGAPELFAPLAAVLPDVGGGGSRWPG